ncbi:C-type lectin domain family 4 member E [Labeo rohita]|uniref:C-type lectin domain family 4 member E n=1 Tax=Labeo rohita TaxID=84645 RepID=A0ABQ8LXD2_LABRO|nr:C-type lectin domain family 4 member E [Labeo rohita]
MADIENYTSLQEFTEDISHSGNRPILTAQGKQGVHKGAKCLRGQVSLVLLIALLASVCANIVLGVLLVNSRGSAVTVKPVKNDESEAASLTLKLTAMQERFSRLCSEYTNLGQTCSKPVIKCRPCPENWLHLEGRCYYFSDDKLDWQHSKESCMSMGGHLTILHNHQQHVSVFWNELGDEPNNHQSGGVHGEDCAVLDSRSKTWFDVPCDFNYKRICEMDPITFSV